jgi:hypothetical protein
MKLNSDHELFYSVLNTLKSRIAFMDIQIM